MRRNVLIVILVRTDVGVGNKMRCYCRSRPVVTYVCQWCVISIIFPRPSLQSVAVVFTINYGFVGILYVTSPNTIHCEVEDHPTMANPSTLGISESEYETLE